MPEPILQFFSYSHLRDDLRPLSARFYDLAKHLADAVPANPERTVALRKLLEAKDAAVRSMLYQSQE